MVTYFVVQPFLLGKKGMIIPAPPIQATDEHHCRRLAARHAETSPCVIAFSRTGNPEYGDWDDAVVIARYGTIPDDIMEMVAA